MVFENVTIFEPHFENVRFGPGSTLSDEDDEREDAPVADDESGRGVLVPVVLSLALALAATAVARRLFGSSDGSDVETFDADESVEAAAE